MWQRSKMNNTATLSSEERWNTITHGFGAVLCIPAFVILMIHAVESADTFKIIGFMIYGISVTSLFLASTFYHAAENKTLKKLFRKIDHSGIYLLIAGTYTPVILTTMRTSAGFTMFVLIWILTIIGIFQKLFWFRKWKKWTVTSYLIMGWMALILIKPLLESIPFNAFLLLLIGGIVYSLGVVFFSWRELKYHHAIWHLFVLLGSSLHYSAMYLF